MPEHGIGVGGKLSHERLKSRRRRLELRKVCAGIAVTQGVIRDDVNPFSNGLAQVR